MIYCNIKDFTNDIIDKHNYHTDIQITYDDGHTMYYTYWDGHLFYNGQIVGWQSIYNKGAVKGKINDDKYIFR